MTKYILTKDYLLFSANIEEKNIIKNKYLLVTDHLEDCLRYINKYDINGYFVKLGTLHYCIETLEYKYESELFPNSVDFNNVVLYINSLFYPYNCDKYNSYFNDSYRPFIKEVWFKEGNSKMLIFKRKTEKDKFKPVCSLRNLYIYRTRNQGGVKQ